MCQLLSCVRLFVTPWTVAHQAPLSVEFSRQEYQNGLPHPPPVDLPDPGIKPIISCISYFAGGLSTAESPGKPVCASVQFSSVAQSCPTLCKPMTCSTPGLPVHHQLPEFTQTCVHRVSDAIQSSHPLSSPFPPSPNPSQHQGLFQ